jgi:poly(A) polymerase
VPLPKPLQPPDSDSYRRAAAIVGRLREAGHEALLAGGCVRDLVLGLEPKDFDITTSARPDTVEELFDHTVPVGKAFGVVVVVDEGEHYEVATFRADGDYADGRRPSTINFSDTAREDVIRRDFTCNALLWDCEAGTIVDYVGGQKDIQARVLRAVGDADLRFTEDRLRMLRAVRHACKLGFTIQPHTLNAVKKHAGAIHAVSPERIHQELTQMWTGPDPKRALELLHATGLLLHVLPEVAALDGVEQPPDKHPEGDVLTHTGLMLAALPEERDAVLGWAAVLHDIGKPDTKGEKHGRITFHRHESVGAEMAGAIAKRLHFSNDQRSGVVALVADHMKFFATPTMHTSTLKKFLRSDRFDAKLELHLADLKSSNGDLTTYEYCRDALKLMTPERLRPPALLTGDDVIALGVARGPRIGQILAAVENAQLEGDVITRDQAMAFAKLLAEQDAT